MCNEDTKRQIRYTKESFIYLLFVSFSPISINFLMTICYLLTHILCCQCLKFQFPRNVLHFTMFQNYCLDMAWNWCSGEKGVIEKTVSKRKETNSLLIFGSIQKLAIRNNSHKLFHSPFNQHIWSFLVNCFKNVTRFLCKYYNEFSFSTCYMHFHTICID